MRSLFLWFCIIPGVFAQGELSLDFNWDGHDLQGRQYFEIEEEAFGGFLSHYSWQSPELPLAGLSLFQSLYAGPLKYSGLHGIAASSFGPSSSSLMESTRLRLDRQSENWNSWGLGLERPWWSLSYGQNQGNRIASLCLGPRQLQGLFSYSRNSDLMDHSDESWYESSLNRPYEMYHGLARYTSKAWGLSLLAGGSFSPCLLPGGIFAMQEQNSLGPWEFQIFGFYSTDRYRNQAGKPLYDGYDLQSRNTIDILDWAVLYFNSDIPLERGDSHDYNYGIRLFWTDRLSSRSMLYHSDSELLRLKQELSWKYQQWNCSLEGRWKMEDSLSLSLDLKKIHQWKLEIQSDWDLEQSWNYGLEWEQQWDCWFYSIDYEESPRELSVVIGWKFS